MNQAVDQNTNADKQAEGHQADDDLHRSHADSPPQADPQSQDEQTRICQAQPEDRGLRLDKFLLSRLEGYSRNVIVKLLRQGHVFQDGDKITSPSARVKLDDVFHIQLPPLGDDTSLRPQDIPLDVLFEDEDIILIDKPAGMVVHPATGWHGPTLVHALLHQCDGKLSTLAGDDRPGIIHRLDRGTSGVMVAAKSDQAYESLGRQWRRHKIERVYQAFVWGTPCEAEGVIEGSIGRCPKDRKKMAIVHQGGKAATSNYRIEEIFADGRMSLLECRPRSGRTHQIRVHLTHIGAPLIGDPLYRKRGVPSDPAWKKLAPNRPALHAAQLAFHHPNGQWMHFQAPLPEDLCELQRQLRTVSGKIAPKR